MAGKRLAAAGALVAAVAASAALWVAPHGSLAVQARALQSRASQSRTIQLSAFTDVKSVATTSAVARAKPGSATWSPIVGLTAVGGTLFALALVGAARRRRSGPVPVRVRARHRGRAPPSPPPPHTARMRNH